MLCHCKKSYREWTFACQTVSNAVTTLKIINELANLVVSVPELMKFIMGRAGATINPSVRTF
ncbi:hypothetical protein PGB90_006441 [Kerria lacca]